MKFYVDEDLSDEVAQIARGLGIDAVSSHEGGRDGQSDPDQLRFAVSEGRCLVSCNRTDFLNLTTLLFERESPHAGVIIVTWALRSQGAVRVAAAIAEHDRRHAEGVSPYTFGYPGAESE